MNIFLKKKILIYGLGKSGLSAYNFLKNKNIVSIYDDYKSDLKRYNFKKKILSYKEVLNNNFDQIIISPGININKCKLSKFLKKNFDKIYSDLDIFYEFYKNDCITITGTNGKSTTCKLLYEVLRAQNFDVKLVGNIGNPILSERNIKKNTIFVIEASSYQLDYSKNFKSKYAVILNLSPDHIERHKTLNNYIKAKFKLLKNQSKNNLAFLKKDDFLINRELRSKKYKCKIIKVDSKRASIFLKKINNEYFKTDANKENLSFVLEILKRFKIRNDLIIKKIQNFKGLNYRQQIIFRNDKLTIINDSKSTSFSSSISILKSKVKIYWLLGGIHKKNDKFDLPKRYFKNIEAFIYGENKNFFVKKLKGKIRFNEFNNIENALKNAIKIITEKKSFKQIILFSPCAASFDSFKNFEDRGAYFNKLIKKYFNGKQKFII